MRHSKLEQAAREVIRQHSMECLSDKAVDAMREALGQLNCQCGDKCFPVFSGDIEYCETCGKQTELSEQAEQEPVAWVWTHEHGGERLEWEPSVATSAFTSKPLYAAPVRTKDLTDDELHQIWRDIKSLVGLYSFQEIARAVIAADREKNK